MNISQPMICFKEMKNNLGQVLIRTLINCFFTSFQLKLNGDFVTVEPVFILIDILGMLYG